MQVKELESHELEDESLLENICSQINLEIKSIPIFNDDHNKPYFDYVLREVSEPTSFEHGDIIGGAEFVIIE